MNRCCGRTLRNRQDKQWHADQFHGGNILNPSAADGATLAPAGNLDQAYSIFKEQLEAAQKVAAEAVRELRQLRDFSNQGARTPKTRRRTTWD